MTIEPIILNVGRSAAQWLQGAQNFFQDFQSSVRRTFDKNQQSQQSQISLKTKYPLINQPTIATDSGPSSAIRDLEPWIKNPAWEDDTPVMEGEEPRNTGIQSTDYDVRNNGLEVKCFSIVNACARMYPSHIHQVTVPEGSLCQLSSTFKVGLPPMAVFDILIDPANKRVFKNIKEVKYRKVLEDYGHRQIVEIEQAAIWRFLWLSGTLSVCVRVDQDRQALSVRYNLAKQGFMKKFEGSWCIHPLYIDMDDGTDTRGRIASLVHLKQVVQPALMPPPPLVSYIRGITTRTTEKMLEDLQEEGRRLREGRAVERELSEAEGKAFLRAVTETQKSSLLRRHWKMHTGAGGMNRRHRRRRRRLEQL